MDVAIIYHGRHAGAELVNPPEGLSGPIHRLLAGNLWEVFNEVCAQNMSGDNPKKGGWGVLRTPHPPFFGNPSDNICAHTQRMN